MLVSTTMRPVTPQTLRHLLDDQDRVEERAALAAEAFGMVMPQKPASASALTLSQGYCSLRSMAAALGRATLLAKSRARACKAISSAVKVGSTRQSYPRKVGQEYKLTTR